MCNPIGIKIDCWFFAIRYIVISPRIRKHSNTEKIIAAFEKGLSENNVTFEIYAISEQKSWDEIRQAYEKNEEILIAFPLYVECVPSLLLEFLEKLTGYLGGCYGGCLVKGDNFGIRILEKEKQVQATQPYQAMGASFAKGEGFFTEEAKKFTGPEYFSLPIRWIMSFVFKTFARKMFQQVAASWGCQTPLDVEIWDEAVSKSSE